MKLTKEKAIEYFNQNAPEKLREQGIVKMEEYAKGDKSLFFINDMYVIRYIVPEPSNCFMRNQRFTPVLKGCKYTKKDTRSFIDCLIESGYSKK